MPNAQPQGSGWVPVPDPTKLTTDAVALARAEIEKLSDTKLESFKELVASEFRGRDTALAAALKSAQELVKQQNDSNTLAIDKAATATTKQMDALAERIDDLKERIQIERGSTAGGRNETIARIVQLVTTVGGILAIIGAIVATRAH
jgi:hypothetical protein